MDREKLNILFLVLEMDLGGLQRMVNLLIRKINTDLFVPYLCCLDRGGMFYESAATHSGASFILERRPGPFDRRLLQKLVSVLKDNGIDIIHSHNGCSSYAALAGRLAKVKGIIHTDHGRLLPEKRTAIIEDRFSSYMMKWFVGVSEQLTEYLAKVVKISRKKLITIINGLDTDTFKPVSEDKRLHIRAQLGLSAGDKVIGTVCRLDPIKNLEFMVSCMRNIVRNVPDAKLVIVGDGLVRESLISQSQTLGLGSKILFPGRREGIETILPAFDVYACSSISEGTSMTILEAMSCGLPVVASSVGGNPKLVDSSNGVLFPVNDAAIFTEGIASLLREPALRAEKGKRGRERVEQDFSVDKMVSMYEALYNSLNFC